MTLWIIGVVVVLAIGAIAVVAAGVGEPLAPAYPDRADVGVPPDRPITAQDLRAVRFNTAVRGYRADEVDALLERLAAELDARSGPEAPGSGTLTP